MVAEREPTSGTTAKCSQVNLDVAGYRTGRISLWEQFLRPALASASAFHRAAGYFDSSVFELDIEMWCGFFKRGGRISLVCSPEFAEKDIEAAFRGVYQAGSLRVVSVNALSGWLQSKPDGERPGTKLFSWAVATRRMEVYVAVPTTSGCGLYHEKFGIVDLSPPDALAFSGSANETAAGYTHNFERLEVFSGRNSHHGEIRLRTFRAQFSSLIADLTPGLKIYFLHEALRNRLLKIRGKEQQMGEEPLPEAIPTPPPEIIRQPPNLCIRIHQERAVEAWTMAVGRGIFSMATGAGKTVAALMAIERVFERKGGPLAAVVVVPYLVLLHQWIAEMQRFGLNPVICAYTRSSWEPIARAAVYSLNQGARPLLSLVVTNTTFATEHFQDVLSQIRVRTILIADEVHNLGANHLKKLLPERISLRLGLSATPERFMDEDGTRAVFSYFGSVIEPFGLADALATVPPVLCPYDYYPIVIALGEEESIRYLELTRRLARLIKNPEALELSAAALSLLLERSRLVATARNKIPALREQIAPFKHSTHCLVYCGDGSIEVAEEAVEEEVTRRQIDEVMRLLDAELGMSVRRYTYTESTEQRADALADFRSGKVQALVAIRCLDEGVDIPAVSRAFILASSTNPRQFIQRRGRVLRPYPGKTHAEIYDFIVAPPSDTFEEGSPEFLLLRNLLKKEMLRVAEFCSTARNKHSARAMLLPITARFGLQHM